jgi:hypothetical protein
MLACWLAMAGGIKKTPIICAPNKTAPPNGHRKTPTKEFSYGFSVA